MIVVELSPSEVYLSSLIGVRRRVASTSKGYSERNGANRLSEAEAWFANVVGAQGEMAAAKALGAYWPALVNASKGDPDIEPHWQVRALARHDYDLIVRDNDRDDHRYILVTGSGPQFTVHGWIMGADAKRPEWLRDRGGRNMPCYWVPQAALTPIERDA